MGLNNAMTDADHAWVWIPINQERLNHFLGAALSDQIDKEILTKIGVHVQDETEAGSFYLSPEEHAWLADNHMQIAQFDDRGNRLGVQFATPDQAMAFVLTWMGKS